MTQRKLNLRTGDTVRVIAGNDAGAQGRILRAIPARGLVVVQEVNMRKHHKRPAANARGGITEGGIVTYEEPIRVSNVMLVCPHCDEPTRVRRRHDADGTIERICKRCDNPIPTAG
ncbi:50S ribosomal protein L24 [Candidatus Palauibacter sp.]|jgi:large subunit ribosomal protein L24|uniref:50S ribosomal protein L24 n=1 Tax=Candidatus Palauibacter sp. TaxID=3101350 RepID=UPI003B027B71